MSITFKIWQYTINQNVCYRKWETRWRRHVLLLT